MVDSDGYFRNWYEKNGDDLNERRRSRYHTDSAYRAKVMEQNRQARQKRRADRQLRTQATREARQFQPIRAWREVLIPLEVEGETCSIPMFTIGALAGAFGKSVQAVRLWERQGILPETPLRNTKGDRLYTLEMIETALRMLEARGRVDSAVTTRLRSPTVGKARTVRFADGSERVVALFRVGTLAQAVGRTVVTLEQLEHRGILPGTPFRAGGTPGYRLYSREMIEAVRNAFEKRGGDVRGEDEWKGFRADVEAAWQAHGVLGATLLDKDKNNGKESDDGEDEG